jgi:protein SCO1/2
VRFLTGPQESIDAICEATGFRYRKQPDGEYSHPATLIMIAPDGRIVRYLYGVKFEPATVRMALLEASEGTIGTPLDRFILWCHQFDPTSKGYVLFAFRLVQIAGLCTIVLLAAGILWMLRRESRIRAAARPTTHS